MAAPTFFELFDALWAETGTVGDISLAQYKTGWAFIGSLPPTVEQFNLTQQLNDQKLAWLFQQLKAVADATGEPMGADKLDTLLKAMGVLIRNATPASSETISGLIKIATAAQAQELTDDTQALTPAKLVSAMGILRGSWAFIASGTFVVPAGVSVLYITACGGGGGGGAYNGSTSGAGGGGGGGSCFKLRLNVTPGDVIPVTVGQGGGGAQTANGTGASGGSTSFGTHVTLNGGAGGISAGQGGVGGGVSGTTGQLGMPGQRGEQYNPLSLSQPQGGRGGASLFGAGGYGGGQGSGNLNGQPAFGYGAGGGGGAQGSGASGTNGFLVVEW
ncbi:glycine-rich domain-containing protein [Achromobacter insolitus]|uniref:glycine-rich domain-containing protein n=1 Tax=Achromobacter insolitus TaxID=217204 RepID=UPI0028AD0CFF|nr:hypothetical protein [Achromobacter insolitus]